MKRTTIMADEGTLLELKAIARRENKSTSQVIREALAGYVVAHRTAGRHKNPLLALVGLFDGGPGDSSERDATVVALAERLKVARVFTLDRRHFELFQPRHCAAFEILP
jgi:hypothetical protein